MSDSELLELLSTPTSKDEIIECVRNYIDKLELKLPEIADKGVPNSNKDRLDSILEKWDNVRDIDLTAQCHAIEIKDPLYEKYAKESSFNACLLRCKISSPNPWIAAGKALVRAGDLLRDKKHVIQAYNLRPRPIKRKRLD